MRVRHFASATAVRLRWRTTQLARATRGGYTAFRRWYVNRTDQILAAVRIDEGLEEGEPVTKVTVRQRLPFASRRARYLVTTTAQRVTHADFGDDAEEINRCATHGVDSGSGKHRRAGKGRVLFLMDLRRADEPFAAIAFHIPTDKLAPPVVRTLAGRLGPDGMLLERSIVGLLLLKAYAHAMSWKMGRSGCLDIQPQTNETRRRAERLGFRRAPSTPSGVFRQEPYVEFEP